VAPSARARERKLAGERAYLSALPRAARYRLSFMHRDVVSHVAAAAGRGFLVSASVDGQLKFWARAGYAGGAGGGGGGPRRAKKAGGVEEAERPLEFVKQFRAHGGPVGSMALSPDGGLLVTVGGADRTAKVFSVDAFDMLEFARLNFAPGAAVVWMEEKRTGVLRFAIAHRDEPKVSLFAADALDKLPRVVALPHLAPVTLMRFNAACSAVVSVDEKGVVEYWALERLGADAPGDGDERDAGGGDGGRLLTAIPGVQFELKGETDLYEFAKARARPTSLEISADGSQFVCMATDRVIRVFNFRTGKLRRSYEESLETITAKYRATVRARGGSDKADAVGAHGQGTAEADFTRRMQREGEVTADAEGSLWRSNAVFDASGNFVVYATVLGIKIVNLTTNRASRTLGRPEGSERFLTVALFQEAAAVAARVVRKAEDLEPLLVATAHDSQRLYLFTRTEPPDGEERDVFNERPRTRRGAAAANAAADAEKASRSALNLAQRVTLHTTCGDITFATMRHCPRAVENFTVHARNGYFDNVLCVAGGDSTQARAPMR
jgi:peptidylprolyl isomerase domain and WD repeat-containing protein 1